jgi:hypothetical protein
MIVSKSSPVFSVGSSAFCFLTMLLLLDVGSSTDFRLDVLDVDSQSLLSVGLLSFAISCFCNEVNVSAIAFIIVEFCCIFATNNVCM